MKKIATIASLLVLAGCGTHRSSSHATDTTASHSPADASRSTGYVSGDDNGSAGSMNGTDRENTAGADATTHDGTATTGSSTATGAISGEKDLLMQLVQMNQMDIEMSRQAKTTSKSTVVKTFAQKAINDHGTFSDKLKPFAQAENVDVASGTTHAGPTGDMQSDDMSTRMDHLKTLQGSAFDKEYVSMMVDGHERFLKVIDDLAGTTTNGKLKSALGEIRPIASVHLASAKELQKAIGGPERQNTRGTDDSGK